MIFYISDLHFGHSNIIRYDNRNFSTVTQMDEALINNWNSVVTKEDTVYILGDITWYNDDQKNIEILKRLNGHKKLVKGNHDKPILRVRKCFDEIFDYGTEFYDGKEFVVLSHYPIAFWNHQFHNSVHLYGHVHNSHQWNMMESWMNEARQLQAVPMRAYNVGCMMPYMNYTPKTLSQIIDGYNTWVKNK
jgi:calcineurin-like phosphoesterase family protein